MADLYGRRCKLTIAIPVATPGDFKNVTNDVIEIDPNDQPDGVGLRIAFKITKTTEKNPNPAEITITNLSPTHRSALQVKGVRVSLEAGYQASGTSLIFSGDARTIDHIRDGANWNSVLKCGDGERAIKYARAAESFAPGTAAADVLKYLGRQLGLDAGNVSREAAKITTRFDQGWCAFGPASTALTDLLFAIGWGYSIQDGAIQVLRGDEPIDGVAIPDIGPDSGLIGSPEMGTPEKAGGPALLKFKSLLTPTRPGAKVRLRSRRYNGELRVKKCVHSGDTMGGEWYTDIEGTIINA